MLLIKALDVFRVTAITLMGVEISCRYIGLQFLLVDFEFYIWVIFIVFIGFEFNVKVIYIYIYIIFALSSN